MVGIGFAMLGLGLWSLVARLAEQALRLAAAAPRGAGDGAVGFVAVIAGWVTTEVGRQPFTVYGLLRTADSVSPLAAPAVAASLVAFVIVYFAVFGIGIWYILKLMHAAAARARGVARAAGAGADPHRRDHARADPGSAWRAPSRTG